MTEEEWILLEEFRINGLFKEYYLRFVRDER